MDHIFIKLERILRYIFFGGLLLLLYSFVNRDIINDEGWLGEQAYFLGTEGYVKSEMFTDFRQSDIQIFSYHKLHVWLGGLLIGLFGLNIFVLKGISLIGLIALIILVFKYYNLTNRTQLTYFTLTFLVVNHHIVEFSFIYRPEMLATAFGFGSFYCLLSASKQKYAIYAAILAGLSALTHLNGIIYMLAGALFLASQKQWKTSVIFSLTSGLTLSLFFIDIFVSGNQLDTFLEQMYSVEPKKNLLFKVLEEHLRMFHSPKEIILSVLCLFVILIPLVTKRLKLSPTLTYFLILGVIFMLVAPNKTYKYLTFLIPFIAINLTESIHYLWQKYTTKQQWLLYSGLVLYVFISMGFTVHFISKNKPVVSQHERIAEYLMEQSAEHELKVGCELIFMYNNIDKFDLRGATKYQYEYRDKIDAPGYKWTLLFEDMFKDDREYIVLSKTTYKIHKYNNALYKNMYKQVLETNNHLIFKRI